METNRATELLLEGNVCAESVLKGVCQEFGMAVDNEVIPGIAFGFAGGIGNTGSVCGAVSGAVMALSLKLGKGETKEEALRVLRLIQQYRERLEAEIGTINCRELTGMDLTTEEGIARFMDSDKPQKVCFPVVGRAYQLAVDLLNENP